MSTQRIIRSLKDRGIHIFKDSDNIKLIGPERQLTKDIISNVRHYKKDILSFIDKSSSLISNQREQIGFIEQQTNYELSAAQKRLWIEQEMAPESASYNIMEVVQLPAPLNARALRMAFSLLIKRHDILRARFISLDDSPRQQILTPKKNQFKLECKEQILHHEFYQLVEHKIKNELSRPFDLASESLFRAHYLSSQTGQSVLILNLHHIICDGWSMNIIYQELFDFYESFQQKQIQSLPALPIQFQNFAEWEVKQMHTDSYNLSRKFWLHKFQGEIPVLNLPTDRPRPAQKTSRGKCLTFSIQADLIDDFQNICDQKQVTLFAGIVSVIYILFSKYTHQKDMIFGIPIAGRTLPETESLIGCFAKTLPLRLISESSLSFSELLSTVMEEIINCNEYQEFPFDSLIDELKIKRDVSRSPLFEILIAMQDLKSNPFESSVSTLNDPNLESEHEVSTKFDLSFGIKQTKDALIISIEYNTALFDSWRIHQLKDHFITIVDKVVTKPSVQIQDINLLEAKEIDILFNQFNPGISKTLEAATLHQLLEKNLDHYRDAIALVFQDKKLTHGELHDLSNQMARYILDILKAKPYDLIGVCMNRTLEMVVTLLGILKAGCTYVPIDPTFPKIRQQMIIEDAETNLLMSDHQMAFNDSNTNICMVIEEWNTIRALDKTPVFSHSNPDALAYIIYTSGSTGKPKGVEISHKNVTNFIQWSRDWFLDRNLNGMLFSTSICFDLSVFELFTPLSSGGQVILVNNVLEIQNIPHYLAIDMINTVPSAMKELIVLDAIPENVRHIGLGGEASSRELVNTIYEKSFIEGVYNFYGPTETTVYSVWDRIREEETNPPAVGKPLYNTRVAVLDEYQKPVPIGIIGEVYLGGTGVSSGYHNLPKGTKERFMTISFPPDVSSIIDDSWNNTPFYKTGDLGYWQPDGRLILLGRKDSQVKVRGYRIELDEIENQILSLPSTLEVSAVIKQDHNDQNFIAAFFTANEKVDHSQLLQKLKETLPGYMIPQRLVQLDEMPHTPNLKIDRKALELPAQSQSESIHEAQELNETERKLTELWKDVLGISHVNLDDEFFQIGGHSLRATRLVSIINRQFKVNLKLQSIFSHSTIRELFPLVEAAKTNGTGEIIKIEEMDFYMCSHAQKSMWTLSQNSESHLAYLLPLRFEINQNLNIKAVRQTLRDLMARHEILRTTYLYQEDQLVQTIKPIEEINNLPFQLTDLSDHKHASLIVQNIINREETTPFDLSSEFPLRVHILKFSHNQFVVLLTFHHIAVDQWSLNILKSEALKIYHSHTGGPLPRLVSLSVQYKDYSVWQSDKLSKEKDHEIYWTSLFKSKPEILSLNTDFPRSAIPTFEGSRFHFSLNFDESKELKEIAFKSSSTLFMTLSSLWKVLFYKYTKQDDLVIGTPISGRDHGDLENQVGCYINTLAIRSKLNPESTFYEFAAHEKERVLEAFKHQSYPFDQLIDQLGYSYEPSRSPLFDFMINVGESDADNKPIDPFHQLNQRSKFDLSFSCNEASEILHCSLEYKSLLYSQQRIELLVSHFKTLVKQVSTKTNFPINKLSLMSLEERTKVTKGFNETYESLPQDITVCDLFFDQAKLHPNQTAIYFKGKKFTYKYLSEKVRKIQYWLQNTHNVGIGTLVGIHMNRTPDMVATLLAIMSSGATYIPVDINYPHKRKEYILKDSEVYLVVCDSEELSELYDVKMMLLPSDKEKITNANKPQHTHCKPESIAYLIYTSGSTGKPKGVEVTHKNLLNLLLWAGKQFSTYELSGLLASTSICFDLSVFELFSPLTHGGSIVLMDHVLELMESEDKAKVTLINTVPSAALELVKADAIPKQVQSVILAGEVLRRNLVNQMYQLDHIQSVYNCYAPSETTTYSTLELVHSKNISEEPSIGQPILNTSIFILDEHMKLVPLGIKGELYISGEGVTKGYYNRSILTQENYVTIYPFGDLQPVRAYKTGDYGEWYFDGRIKLSGREDNQIKLRGYRIEIGEIEAQLVKYPEVSSVCVLKKSDEDHEYLVAYVQTDHTKIEESELKQFLQQRLPSYMVPDTIVFLKKFLLTPNGKIDKLALPNPQIKTLHSINEINFNSELELKLATIWSKILNLEVVLPQDHFFKLGGHSLKAVRLITKIYKQLGVQLKINDIFTHPTLEQLAQFLKGKDTNTSSAIPQIRLADHYEVSPQQEQLWLQAKLEQNPVSYNIPMQFEINIPLNFKILEEAFLKLIGRHESLRTSFLEIEGELRQRVSPLEQCQFSIKLTDLCRQPNQEQLIKNIVAHDLMQPYNLTKPPLIRAHLIITAQNCYQLLLNVHHIISDGWSLSIMMRELFEFYDKLAQNETNFPTQLPVQFKDIVAWQNARLRGDENTALKNYWMNQLSGKIIPIDLPLDKPRTEIKTTSGKIFFGSISKDIVIPFKKILATYEATLFMGFLAVFKTLIYKYTGSEDIIVGCPIAGRDHPDMEGQLGLYTRTLPLRSKLSGTTPFSTFLQHLRDITLSGYQNQLYPFDLATEELKIKRNPSRSLLFDIMVVMQNFNELDQPDSQQQKEDSENTIQNIHQEEVFCKYDWLFSIFEVNGGLDMKVEYNTDLYEEAKIEQFIAHLSILMKNASSNPNELINNLRFCYKEDLRVQKQFNSLLQKNKPLPLDEIKINDYYTDSKIQHKYTALSISNFFSDKHGIGTHKIVAIIDSDNLETATLIQGIKQAECHLLILQSEIALEHMKRDVDIAKVEVIIASTTDSLKGEQLLWGCKSMKHLLVLDAIHDAKKHTTKAIIQDKYWNDLSSSNDIFEQSGRPLQTDWKGEMKTLKHHLKNRLDKTCKILEIGCGNGLIMNEIASDVDYYTGIDFSDRQLQLARKNKRKNKLRNVSLFQMAAHEISELEAAHFDLIILSDVAQWFDNYNYFETVLELSLKKLNTGGVIYLKGLPELVKRKTFLRKNDLSLPLIADLVEHGLWFSKAYFSFLGKKLPNIETLTWGEKLTKRQSLNDSCRFDVLITATKKSPKQSVKNIKRRWTNQDLISIPHSTHSAKHTFQWTCKHDEELYTFDATQLAQQQQWLENQFPELTQLKRYHTIPHSILSFPTSSAEVSLIAFSQFCNHEFTSSKHAKDVALVCTAAEFSRLIDLHEVDSSISLFKHLKLVVVFEGFLSQHNWSRISVLTNTKVIQLAGLPNAPVKWFVYEGQEQVSVAGIVLGKPVSYMEAYCLDSANKSLPPNITGTICLGGLAIPKNFKASFQHPFNNKKYVFKSKLQGRWTTNGLLIMHVPDPINLLHLQRIQQETEHYLNLRPEVKGAVVQIIDFEKGNPSLQIYIETDDKQMDSAQWNQLIKRHIAGINIPISIQKKVLPRTTGGIINKSLLQGIFEAPSSFTEQEVAKIWKAVLKIKKVSVVDHFFHEGGNSIQALQLISKLNSELQLSLLVLDIFEYPTIRELSNKIGELSNSGESQGIPSVKLAASYEISHAQKRLWIISQSLDASLAYHISETFHIDEFNEELFNRTWYDLMERHESLRTYFFESEKGIRQGIMSSSDFQIDIETVDLTHDFHPDSTIAHISQERSEYFFDLEEAPLFRLTVFKLPFNQAVIHTTMHHIITDGWSTVILKKEFLQMYTNYVRGITHRLPTQKITYKDFAHWQNNILNSEEITASKNWWLKLFDSEITPLQLPTDFRRANVQSYNGKVHSFHIEEELLIPFRILLKQHEATELMGLMTIVNILLYRYSGQSDIVIGSPITGREHPDLESIIGFFVQTMAIRNQFDKTDSVSQVLKRVKEVCLGAFSHQSYPFDSLVEEINPPREKGRSPLFDVMLVLQNISDQNTVDSTYTSISEDQNTHAKFDLVFGFESTQNEQGMNCSIEYKSGLYLPETIHRMANHLKKILKNIIKNPDLPVSQVNFMDEAEREFALFGSNNPVVNISNKPRTLVALFEKQAAQNPLSKALTFRNRSWSFEELKHASDALAATLIHHQGIQKNDLIGLMMNRSDQMIVALLAILKTGAGYVPLDPNYPLDRLHYMINDSAIKLVVTESELVHLTDGFNTSHFCIDSDEALHMDLQTHPINVTVEGNNPAFVIYTSGSSGNPKGVLIRHHNVVNAIIWSIDFFNPEGKYSTFSSTSINFDLSALEIYQSLGSGGHLIIGDSIFDLAENNNIPHIDLMFGVPSAIRELVKLKAIPKTVHMVSMGGEALDRQLVNEVFQLEHVEYVNNMYGPSETSIIATNAPLKRGDSTIPPIGKPLPNIRMYVLNENLEPNPIGTIGELYISGICVADEGYLNNPEKSELVFMDDPFVKTDRMYKTGDLGRRLSDGNIAFVGRADQQIKIRGFRVEIGEIEARLSAHKDIKELSVLAVKDSNDDSYLEAYVLSENIVSGYELKSWMKVSLPEYMVPQKYIQVEAFPLMPNGKLDKKKLRKLGGKTLSSVQDEVKARNEIEAKLTLIFMDLLGLATVSVKDDFFEIGGQSLKTIRMCSKISQTFGISLSIKSIFKLRTIEQIALEIEAILWVKKTLESIQEKVTQQKTIEV
ncbi:Tyrocidine synthase 3 [Kordia antarctica]|uniref:Tyrocidine synthase 3 n=1 Tax=Kordia antarctica TaxID=1218801 RepID=A0A7L4ZGU9_9FLAO|nr:non-ribosomal peptide synthetase [Kordia antarctica]QHI35943.1 Tyrocidine synthase 3 [Kordia antarctica]